MFHTTATDLPRVMDCNGSRLLTTTDNNSASDKRTADEGIAAHYMAQAVLSRKVTNTSELIDHKAPNGVWMTAEMAEHVDVYVNTIMERGWPDYEIEKPLSFSDGRSFIVDGRADNIHFLCDELFVDDMKYGYRLHEPFNNWTLLSHAISYITEKNLYPKKVIMTIFQPRVYHHSGKVRPWSITGEELFRYKAILINTLQNLSDQLRVGPYCSKCPANGNCFAARAADNSAFELAYQAFDDNINNDDLARHLDMIKSAKDHLKASEDTLLELANHRVKSGQKITNYFLETTYGNRAWSGYVNVDIMKALTGKDLSKPGLITPAQAEKAGVPKEVVASLTYRPQTGIKLVREDTNNRAKRLLEKGN